jgi:hypothetical protein
MPIKPSIPPKEGTILSLRAHEKLFKLRTYNMGSDEKRNEAGQANEEDSHESPVLDEHPPAYDHEHDLDPSSLSQSVSISPAPSSSPAHIVAPTPESPFNFPLDGKPSNSSILERNLHFAIPQTNDTPTSRFIPAYPPALLTYGIPESTWLSFLSTISAFLAASTSKRALAHAADIAASSASVPRQFGSELVSNTTRTGKDIARHAKHLNPIGVVGEAVGLVVGSAFHLAGSAVGSVFHLPVALATKPQTPWERVEAYLGTANETWLHARRLDVRLLGMSALAVKMNIPEQRILEVAQAAKLGGAGAEQQIAALRPWVGEMVLCDEDVALRKTRSNVLRRKGRDVGDQKQGMPNVERGESSTGGNETGRLGRGQEGQTLATPKVVGRDQHYTLQLGPGTMWLMVTRWEAY